MVRDCAVTRIGTLGRDVVEEVVGQFRDGKMDQHDFVTELRGLEHF